VREKSAYKFDRMIWDRLMSHVNENPVEREVDLITRILSVCVNSKNTPCTIAPERSGHCASLVG
jgi:hypothetical protein